ncbi:hypothetical protein BV509_18760 [Rhodovulum sulfidophilum]|uniref:Cytochrome c n=1 Tax=Rhodovulum visakhapatnamense TaxID=364297 RepID=A0A4R8FM25_9RHOB|nr:MULTISPECIES: cytochrome c family protein [Rhodovulum]MBL3569060.1 cytochrome c family protein [Rhodovulum visakhapatnamense]MBL3577022.1 cytochrome c family protein [Rhodovulum visakhapatnamense]OLS46189.1 hypothetical protein BV509_18760 [Rhodovulum sulfidophilum]TDX24147.1 cytochrome c [Rhodovulum visakhapatnamense]
MLRKVSFTKLLGAGSGALLLFVLVNRAGGFYFTPPELEKPAYVVIEEEPETPAEPEQELTFEERMAQADAAAGERVFNQCKSCHRVEEGVNAVGPSLYGVVGRPVHAVADFSYSDAMAGLEGEWTAERIYEFIAAPRDVVPGTAMTFAGLKDPQDRANVIAYLDSLGD